MENNLNHALFYLKEAGFSVIPWDGKNKTRIAGFEWKPYQTRKPTEEEVREWWRIHPEASVAVITGKISGISVIDIDTDKGGDPSVLGLDEIETPSVRSGGGGFHFYFKYDERIPTVANAKKHINESFPPGLDFRNDGGIIVLPPSDHPSGNKYEWLNLWGEYSLQDIPLSVLSMLGDGKRKTDWDDILNGVIQEGSRNATATSVAGKLLLRFAEAEWESQAWPLLSAWNISHNKPPISERELRTVFFSIAKAEAARRKTGNEVGEPSVERSEDSFTVHVPIKDGFAVFTFDEPTYSRGDLEAVVRCHVEIPGTTARSFESRLNALSSSGRESFARQLSQSFGKLVPWALVLSQSCAAFSEAYRRGLAGLVKDASEIVLDETEDQYLLHPFIVRNAPNILFGMGGSGKTYLALRMMMDAASGTGFLGNPAPQRPSVGLFLDYENNEQVFLRRVNSLSKFCPMFTPEDKKRLHYLNARGTPLHELRDSLKRIIKERSIDLMVVDSAALACGGQPEDAMTANRLFNALGALKTTSLFIAHETKAENHNYVFGSVFFHNSARNIWNVQKDQEQEENVIHAGLFHRKANDDRLHAPKSARIFFGSDGVDINPEATGRWIGEVGPRKRILGELGTTKKSYKELQEALPDIEERVLRSTLSQLKAVGKVVNPGRGFWEIPAPDKKGVINIPKNVNASLTSETEEPDFG